MIQLNPLETSHTLTATGRNFNYSGDVVCVVTRKGSTESVEISGTYASKAYYGEVSFDYTDFEESTIYYVSIYEGTTVDVNALFFQGIIFSTSQTDYDINDGEYNIETGGDNDFTWVK